MERDRITLPTVPLQPGNSFKVMVLLSGTTAGEEHEVITAGELHKGVITTEQNRRKFKRVTDNRITIMWRSLTFLIVGALAVVFLLNFASPFAKRPEGLVCVPGSLIVEGSSVFGLATTKSAGSHESFCTDSFITVKTPGSLDGLADLSRYDPGKDRRERLAFADGKADEQKFPGLTHNAVAIIPFTFVANNKVPVDELSLDQERAIFTGKVSRWSQITGKPEDSSEIHVIGRTDSSGTRHGMETYVLRGQQTQAGVTSDSCEARRSGQETAPALVCEKHTTSELLNRVAKVDFAIGYADSSDVVQTTGVKQIRLDGRGAALDDIRAGYPFWTVEYLYSHGQLAAGSLSAAFANYLRGPEGHSMIFSFQYYACYPDDHRVTDLCSSGR
ncbi:MAG TPA: substrate-binding domain-containing protein [Pseudonocardiaceae bacterium]|nr:substrate-binding domain-containing protein [Pseudonocardiaceae bacterium]